MSRKCLKVVFEIAGFLVALQLLRIGIKSLCFLGIGRTEFTDRAVSSIAMVLITAMILLAAKIKKVSLSIFPKHFGAGYIVFTAMVAALLILTPLLTKNTSTAAIILLIYSAVVTPVFEELIFRGLVWNQLNMLFKKEWYTYAVSTLLFGVWHLGYYDSIAFRVETELANIMIWKVITGLCFGVVLGALRLKTKNSYSTMLLHGVLNVFAR